MEKETKIACALPCFYSFFVQAKRMKGKKEEKKQVGKEEIKVWNSPIC